MAKKAIEQGFNQDIEVGLEIEKNTYSCVIDTYDRKEALNAFIEKREPVFKNE